MSTTAWCSCKSLLRAWKAGQGRDGLPRPRPSRTARRSGNAGGRARPVEPVVLGIERRRPCRDRRRYRHELAVVAVATESHGLFLCLPALEVHLSGCPESDFLCRPALRQRQRGRRCGAPRASRRRRAVAVDIGRAIVVQLDRGGAVGGKFRRHVLRLHARLVLGGRRDHLTCAAPRGGRPRGAPGRAQAA